MFVYCFNIKYFFAFMWWRGHDKIRLTTYRRRIRTEFIYLLIFILVLQKWGEEPLSHYTLLTGTFLLKIKSRTLILYTYVQTYTQKLFATPVLSNWIRLLPYSSVMSPTSVWKNNTAVTTSGLIPRNYEVTRNWKNVRFIRRYIPLIQPI